MEKFILNRHDSIEATALKSKPTQGTHSINQNTFCSKAGNQDNLIRSLGK